MQATYRKAGKIITRKKITKSRVYLFLMILPFIIFIFAFSYVPLFGWVFAFFNFKPGIPLSDSHFEGLKYFKLMLNDRYDLTRVLTNTLAMSFLGILCSVFPVTLAIMITEVKSKFFRKFIQTTTTLPNFISWVIIFSVAFTIFSSDGLMNQVLTKAGLTKESVNILGNANIVWIFQTLLGLWKGLGWGSIIYIAAITGIDGELYDAAKVDGAGRFRCIRHITLPGIASTYFVLLLLSISSMLSVGFEQYFVFYNSMVADKIEVLDYYVYKLGLVTHDYSYSTAVGILKTVVSLILLFSVNKLSKKIRGNSII